jgi:hypothetical protein
MTGSSFSLSYLSSSESTSSSLASLEISVGEDVSNTVGQQGGRGEHTIFAITVAHGSPAGGVLLLEVLLVLPDGNVMLRA